MKPKLSINPLLLTVSLLFILLVLLFVSQLEKVEVSTHTGLKGEARSNPLYAHRLFLKRMGVAAERIQTIQALTDLPPSNSVIYLDSDRTTMPPNLVDALLDWVKRGGHLITIANTKHHGSSADTHDQDYLQQSLGITVGKHIYLDDDKADVGVEKKSDNTLQEAAWQVHFGQQRFTLQPDFFYELNSDFDDQPISINNKTFMLNIHVDDGLVSLVSHLDFLHQEQLGNHDHASFLYYLIRYHHDQAVKVWLISQTNMPSLWALLWQYTPLMMISLLLLFSITLYTLGQRLGPMIPKPSLQRRRLMEHIKASGYFLWKYRQQTLIDSSRKALNQCIAKHYTAWNNLEQHEQIDYLHEQTKYTQAHIKWLLFDDLLSDKKPMSEETFTHWMQQLEQTKKKIQL